MNKTGLTLLFSILFFSVKATDILTLNNQKVFEGKVSKIKNCIVEFKIENEKYLIPASEISTLEFGNKNDKVYKKYLNLNNSEADNCMKGNLDAGAFHGKKGGHYILGVLFGPFAIIGTALANPTPMKGKNTMALSKNKELFSDLEYLSCYKKQAKAKLIGAEALGWATWVLFILIM